MDRQDTRIDNDGGDGVCNGWLCRNVYYAWRLAHEHPSLRLRDHRGATGHAHVFNCSHNGSQIGGHMKILTYILAGSAPLIALVMALQLDAAKAAAAFERERCDAFHDVVGDYIDATNQLKAQGWSDSVLPE